MTVATREKTAVRAIDMELIDGKAEDGGPHKGRARQMYVRLDRIDDSRNHRRSRPGDAKKIQQLAETIKEHGMLQPIGVAVVGKELADDAKIVLMFGARRLQAAKLLGWDRVVARVFFLGSDAEIESLRAVENLHRDDITAIEQAQAVSDIVEFHLEAHPKLTRSDALKYAANQTGQTDSWVRDHDYFVRLSDDVRALALAVMMPAGHLRELAKVGNPADQWNLAVLVVGGALIKIGPDGDVAFKKPRHNSDWYRKSYDDLIEAIELGAVRFHPIRELRDSVSSVQRKLRAVPWDLTLPVLHKKTTLPACLGCVKNSATEPGLFGLDDAPEVKDATCGDAACYILKQASAEAARARLLKKYEKAEDVPKPDAIAKTLAQKVIASAGLDVKKATGFVQREVKKRVAPASGTTSSGAGTSNTVGGRRKPTEHEHALGKFREAVAAWFDPMAGLIEKSIGKKVVLRAGVMLLCATKVIDDLDEIDIPQLYLYNADLEKGVPKLPGPLPKELIRLIGLLEVGTTESVVQIAGAKLTQWEPVRVAHINHHPSLPGALLLALGNDIELPAFPQWEEFAPAAPKEPKAKPAPKKKRARKKVAKKKAVKK